MKRPKDNSDVPEGRHGTLLTQIQDQRERQNYILLACGGMDTPSCFNKRAGGKKVCGGFRSEYAYGSKSDLDSVELETTAMTANGEVQGPWENLPLDQRSKTTSHQKWQEN